MKHREWTLEDLKHVEFKDRYDMWEKADPYSSCFVLNALYNSSDSFAMFEGKEYRNSYTYRLNPAYLAGRNKKMSEEQQEVKVIKLWYLESKNGDVAGLLSDKVDGYNPEAFIWSNIKRLQEHIQQIQEWIDSQNAANCPKLEVYELPHGSQVAVCLPANFPLEQLVLNRRVDDLLKKQVPLYVTKEFSLLYADLVAEYQAAFAEQFPPKPRLELKVIPMVEGEPEESK